MPGYAPNTLLRPKSVEEAITQLKKWGQSARLVAGHTTLYELVRGGALGDVQCLIDVSRLGLDYITLETSGIQIGAATTFSDLAKSPLLESPEYFAVKETAGKITPPQIRNVGTLGGSICSGIPFYDMPTTLLALDAEVKVASADGAIVLPIDDFFIDYFVTALSPESLVTGVEIARSTITGSSFTKIGRISADFAVVNAAARVQLDSHRRNIVSVRVALGAVARTPIRAVEAERVLQGKETSKSVVQLASSLAIPFDPTPSIHASSAYKKMVTPILVRDVLCSAIKRAGGEVSNS